MLKLITSGVSVHLSVFLFAVQEGFKKMKETMTSNRQTIDPSFPAVKELSDYTGGNYSNPKLSFLF